ncbi:hypothetical protein M9H77_17251 [Catharanthus roseus]|uniref:Uncharacterized protein n=1 Tax=Catharanthus roseus TaxID=4058 RepID=A0ACC0B424_CATRO|nr:hypothetical protein M9H77_17251 [Catharanthus roseus]
MSLSESGHINAASMPELENHAMQKSASTDRIPKPIISTYQVRPEMNLSFEPLFTLHKAVVPPQRLMRCVMQYRLGQTLKGIKLETKMDTKNVGNSVDKNIIKHNYEKLPTGSAHTRKTDWNEKLPQCFILLGVEALLRFALYWYPCDDLLYKRSRC